MNHITIIALTLIFSINVGILYLMYKYIESLVSDIYNRIDHSEINNRFGIDCEKKVINERIDKLSNAKSYDLEIHKLRDEMQNNALCCVNGIHSALRDIVDIRTDLEELTKKSEGSKSMVKEKGTK